MGNEPLRPWNLRHDRRLIDIAYRYIRDTIQRPFISVHVRSERHLIWKGVRAHDVHQKTEQKVRPAQDEIQSEKDFPCQRSRGPRVRHAPRQLQRRRSELAPDGTDEWTAASVHV